MKRFFVLLSAIVLLCLTIVELSSCKKEQNNSENQPSVGVLTAKGFTMDGNVGTLTVSNNTKVYSFINQISVQENASWSISTDLAGKDIITTKTISLEVGDNTVYLLVSSDDGKEINLYTMTIRRRPMYTVTFQTGGGNYVPMQHIEESSLATEPIATRPGYTFTGWDYDFTIPIIRNTVIHATWQAQTNIPYKVEYYLQNLNNDEYTLQETLNFTGTAGTEANAEIKTFEHFTYNQNICNSSGVINGDGSLVLKLYYTRNKYLVSITGGNSVITNPVNGYYKYGYSVESCFVKSFLGYEFDGWYCDEKKETEKDSLGFIVSGPIAYISKSKIKGEMSNFVFSSTTTTCSITGIKDKTIPEIIVPDYVTSIDKNIFSDGSSFTNVIIGHGITSIPIGLLSGCSSLTSLTIPFVGAVAGKTEKDYHQNPFGYIFGTVSYADSTAIQQHYYDSSLSNTTNTTYYIPISLQSVTVTGGNILYGAFCNCNGLTSVTIGDRVSSIGNYAFSNCSNLVSISIGNNVTSIGEYAFKGCSSLTSITIPDGVTNIGASTFSGCSSLASATISDNVTSIGNNAFYNCSSLMSFAIPDGVMSIGESTFSGCNSLMNITISNNVTSIGEQAFYNCNGLVSITIPNGVTNIGDDAFFGCYKLVEVYNKSSLNIIKGNTGKGYVGYYARDIYTEPYVSKLSIDANGYILYTDGIDISLIGYTGTNTRLILPNGITEINRNAFSGCSSFTSITIPNSVKNIGTHAFSGCSGLTNISIPNSVLSIGSYAFSGCSSLISMTIPFVGAAAGKTENDANQYPFGYIFGSASYAGGTLTWQSYRTSSTSSTFASYYIPTSLRSVTVTSGNILYGAFYNCSNLTNITIPDDTTSIGSYAFYCCMGLSSIVIPDKVENIGSFAFYGCSGLTSITIPFIGANRSATAHEAVLGYIFGYTTNYDVDRYQSSPSLSFVSTQVGTKPSGTIWQYSCYNCQRQYQKYYLCSYFYYIPKSLRTVTVNEGNIPDYAFYNCNVNVIKISRK